MPKGRICNSAFRNSFIKVGSFSFEHSLNSSQTLNGNKFHSSKPEDKILHFKEIIMWLLVKNKTKYLYKLDVVVVYASDMTEKTALYESSQVE